MIMHAPRQVAVMTFSLLATAVYPVRSLLLMRSLLRLSPRQHLPHTTPCRSYSTRSTLRLWAAPGVSVASPEAIRRAMQDPSTTIIDARSVGEIEQNGCYTTTTTSTTEGPRWVHAEATAQQAPLLQVAASTLLPRKDAPVVIYCGSGIRATTCKTVLEQQGYTNVLNAGGLADLQQVLVESEEQ